AVLLPRPRPSVPGHRPGVRSPGRRARLGETALNRHHRGVGGGAGVLRGPPDHEPPDLDDNPSEGRPRDRRPAPPDQPRMKAFLQRRLAWVVAALGVAIIAVVVGLAFGSGSGGSHSTPSGNVT